MDGERNVRVGPLTPHNQFAHSVGTRDSSDVLSPPCNQKADLDPYEPAEV